MFYATVPVIVYLFRRFGHFPVLLTLYFVSVAYMWFMTMQAEHSGSGVYLELARQLPGQLAYFMAGAFFYFYFPLFERRFTYFAAFFALALLVNFFYPIPLVWPFFITNSVAFYIGRA